jgi:hypothetical protein
VLKKRQKINMSETPRTDAVKYHARGQFQDVVAADFARTLERENARLRAIFPKILEALQSGACSPDCSIEFMQQIPNEVRLVIRGHSPVVDETDKQNR